MIFEPNLTKYFEFQMQKIENFAFSPGKWSKTSKMKTFDTFMTEIFKNFFQFGCKNSKMSKSKVLLKLIFWEKKLSFGIV